MTQRVEGGTTYTQIFDVENRLVSVAVSGGGTTQYQYDANGQMLKKIAPDGTVTVYLGLVEYELTGGAVSETTSYYNVPGARVVWRRCRIVLQVAGGQNPAVGPPIRPRIQVCWQ